MTNNTRTIWIDCVKGLGILLVIFGHTLPDSTAGNLLRMAIYSFHMPLFFILSGMTFRCSANQAELTLKAKKAFHRLMLPVFFLFGIMVLYQLILTPANMLSPGFWRREGYRLVLGSGVVWQFGDLSIPVLGLPWFLYVLFLSRTLYDYLHLNLSPQQLPIAVWAISLMGVLLGTEQDYLPFSADIALSVLPFFLFGAAVKTKSRETPSLRLLLLSAVLWAVLLRLTVPNTSIRTYLELAGRRYPLFPLCYAAAAAGSLAFCEIGKAVSTLAFLSKPLQFLGRNSLDLLMVHALDTIWSPWWSTPSHWVLSSLMRILIDLGFFLIITAVRRKLSQAKRERQG